MSVIIEIGVNSYVTVAEANTYMAASFRGADFWAALTEEQKLRALITAFRIFETIRWVGQPTEEDQDAAWPRTGTLTPDGRPLPSDVVPQEIKDAQIEFAFEIASNSTVETTTSTSSNIKRVQAGDAVVEFFAPGTGQVIPEPAFRPIAHLIGGTTIVGACAFGTDGTTASDNEGTLVEPYG